MTEKKLKRLNRSELLEMLLAQSKEVEHLKEELKIAKEALESKRRIELKAGSIAEASLKLTNIFEDAQKAADIYLQNIKWIQGETWKEAEKILREAYKRAALK